MLRVGHSKRKGGQMRESKKVTSGERLFYISPFKYYLYDNSEISVNISFTKEKLRLRGIVVA